MDELRQYLYQHRDKLDIDKPPAEAWQNIAKASGHKQPPVLYRSIVKWVAAASIVVFTSLSLYHFHFRQASSDTELVNSSSNSKSPEYNGQQDSSTNEQPAPELLAETVEAEKPAGVEKKSKALKPAKSKNRSKNETHSLIELVEGNYASVIKYQLKRLKKTPIYVESPDYFHVFKKQWYDLEKDEAAIRDDIKMYGISDKLVDHMINISQQKLTLLKQLQTEINQMNNRAKLEPSIHRKKPSYIYL